MRTYFLQIQTPETRSVNVIQSALCNDCPLYCTHAQLEGPLRNLWFPTPDRDTSYETSFIVVGPIPNDNPGHLTTGLANTSGVANGLNVVTFNYYSYSISTIMHVYICPKVA